MSDSTIPLERIGRAFVTPTRGVLGVVDELLATATEHSIRLLWKSGRYWLQLDDDDARRVELPVGQSVMRAILARIAALCNERRPGSTSPYRGEGEITIDAEPAGIIFATFVNTSEEQSLELAPVRSSVGSNSS